MQTVLEKIASFAVHTDFDQIPADVAAVAKLGLTDFFACSLAGINAPVSKNILNYLNTQGLKEGPCRLFGTSHSAGLKEAALFNGVSSHCMDFDDVSWATIGHPSVSVAPSVFACAQKGKWNGKQTLLAYVLAVESMHQIARLTSRSRGGIPRLHTASLERQFLLFDCSVCMRTSVRTPWASLSAEPEEFAQISEHKLKLFMRGYPTESVSLPAVLMQVTTLWKELMVLHCALQVKAQKARLI